MWHICFDTLHLAIRAPVVDDTFLEWWIETRRSVPSELKRGYDTFVILVAWEL